jgi:glycosyltransferase involved in cell wall biosynthesis
VRLLHLIPRFIGGGPERALLMLIEAWRAAGYEAEHEIRVIEPPLSAALVLKARRLGARVSVDRAASGAGDLMASIEQADLVMVQYWNHPRLLDAMREPWPASRVLLRMAIRGTTVPHVATAELGDFADHLVASSPRTLETPTAQRISTRGGQVAWAPALSDMSRLEGFTRQPHEGLRIGHVGLVDPAKMHPRFAELCAAVRRPEVAFDVFGPGRLDELRERFAAVGLANRAHVHGPTEDLAGALSGLDIVGHPLALDGYATSEKTVQEAMWVGLPVVVLAGTGPADLIAHDETGLVAADEDDYPRQLERLVDDAELRHRLGAAASGFAREHFDPAHNAHRLWKTCENTLGHAKRTREPLPGAGASPARRFVHSLGHLAGPFAVSLEGAEQHGVDAVGAAERAIAASSPVVAQGEGGVVHHRNTWPDDPHLRLWSGLIAAAAGRSRIAADEFAAGSRHGVLPLQSEAGE